MMCRPINAFVSAVLVCTTLFAHATFAETVLRSGDERVSLLELYTSEGCNSCPPADQWLSKLTTDPNLWTKLIPVAFHVDYWNDLGWQDRFSQAAFSQRQHSYAELGGLRFVYTPGFVLDGQEWTGFRNGRKPNGAREKTGALTVHVRDEEILVNYRPTMSTGARLTVNVALLGFGLTSEIRSGENQGRLLHHDFVVTDLIRKSLDAVNGSYETSTRLPQTDHKADRFALAVWVSVSNAQAPLQAVGGWLDDDEESLGSAQTMTVPSREAALSNDEPKLPRKRLESWQAKTNQAAIPVSSLEKHPSR